MSETPPPPKRPRGRPKKPIPPTGREKANLRAVPNPPTLIRSITGELVPETAVYDAGWVRSSKEDGSYKDATLLEKDDFSDTEGSDGDLANSDEGSDNLANTPNFPSINLTPAKLRITLRQRRAFDLNVIDGLTPPHIAETLKVSLATVYSDLQHEAQLRVAELEEHGDAEKVRQLYIVTRMLNEARELRDKPGTGAFGAYAKAIEMRAKLLGLDAPTKIELGVSQLLSAISDLPEPQRIDAMTRVIHSVPAVTDSSPASVTPQAQIDTFDVDPTDARDVIASDVAPDAAPSLEGPADAPARRPGETDDDLRARALAMVDAASAGAPPVPSSTAARFGRDPVTGAPPAAQIDAAAKDPLAFGLSSARTAARAAQTAQIDAGRSTERVSHVPGTPVVDPRAAAPRARSNDPAAETMGEAWFLALPAATQAAVVASIRATGTTVAVVDDGAPSDPYAPSP